MITNRTPAPPPHRKPLRHRWIPRRLARFANPEWCHPDSCTATPREPVTISVDYSLAVTATLYKAHARWLTEVLRRT